MLRPELLPLLLFPSARWRLPPIIPFSSSCHSCPESWSRLDLVRGGWSLFTRNTRVFPRHSSLLLVILEFQQLGAVTVVAAARSISPKVLFFFSRFRVSFFECVLDFQHGHGDHYLPRVSLLIRRHLDLRVCCCFSDYFAWLDPRWNGLQNTTRCTHALFSQSNTWFRRLKHL